MQRRLSGYLIDLLTYPSSAQVTRRFAEHLTGRWRHLEFLLGPWRAQLWLLEITTLIVPTNAGGLANHDSRVCWKYPSTRHSVNAQKLTGSKGGKSFALKIRTA